MLREFQRSLANPPRWPPNRHDTVAPRPDFEFISRPIAGRHTSTATRFAPGRHKYTNKNNCLCHEPRCEKIDRGGPPAKMVKKCAPQLEPTELVRVCGVHRLVSVPVGLSWGAATGGRNRPASPQIPPYAELPRGVGWSRGAFPVPPRPGPAATAPRDCDQSPVRIGNNAVETQSLLPFGAKPCSRAVKPSAN